MPQLPEWVRAALGVTTTRHHGASYVGSTAQLTRILVQSSVALRQIDNLNSYGAFAYDPAVGSVLGKTRKWRLRVSATGNNAVAGHLLAFEVRPLTPQNTGGVQFDFGAPIAASQIAAQPIGANATMTGDTGEFDAPAAAGLYGVFVVISGSDMAVNQYASVAWELLERFT